MRTRKFAAAALLTLVAAAAPTAARANLLVNGSFEAPAASPPYSTDGLPYYFYIRTNTPPPGWSQAGNQWPILVARTGGWIASDGVQYTEVESCCAGTIFQPFTTTPGAAYSVSYDYAPQPGVTNADDSIRVLIDGVEADFFDGVAGPPGPLTWTTRSFTFTAAASTTELRFVDGLAGVNFIGPLLDNVVVDPAAIPEPAVFVLALTGLGLAAVTRRHKRRLVDGERGA